VVHIAINSTCKRDGDGVKGVVDGEIVFGSTKLASVTFTRRGTVSGVNRR